MRSNGASQNHPHRGVERRKNVQRKRQGGDEKTADNLLLAAAICHPWRVDSARTKVARLARKPNGNEKLEAARKLLEEERDLLKQRIRELIPLEKRNEFLEKIGLKLTAMREEGRIKTVPRKWEELVRAIWE